MQLLIAHKAAAARAALTWAITDGWDGDFEVIESGEGTQAVELLLQDDAPRLAVVDWDLPGLDGPELCRLVRDYHPGGPPYILLLAAGRHPDIGAGLEAGANDCIRTPAGAAEIRDRVDAGRRFVQVPWERAARGATLEAGRSRDTDDDPPAPPESHDVCAGAGAPRHRKVELQAVRSER
jgi:DNA-binding response OmpR family regulator